MEIISRKHHVHKRQALLMWQRIKLRQGHAQVADDVMVPVVQKAAVAVQPTTTGFRKAPNSKISIRVWG